METDLEPVDPAAGLIPSNALADLAAARERAEQLATMDEDLDLAGMTPEERRDALNHRRAELDAAREALQSQATAVEAELKRQMEQVMAAVRPLREKAELMLSGVQAIALYLGSDEEIFQLRDGEPAPAATPITVYQNVLFMDEEMALAAEQLGIEDGTIDPGPRGWKDFDAWLLADDAHVRQVCPAPRGVVAFRSAREQRKHGPEHFFGDGSDVTHFLVVNGEQLTWVNAADDFAIGNRLIPARGEFERYFHSEWKRDEFGRPEKLQPGTMEWEKAAKGADRAQKHYLKITLILQGIVDRTTMLSPLPADDVSFSSVRSYDEGHIVAVVSDNGSALTSGVLPFKDWRSMIGRDLEVGQRVVLGSIPHTTLHGENRWDYHALHPRTASHPPAGVPLEVKRRGRSNDLYVSFPRTDQVWKSGQPVPDKPGYVYTTPILVDSTGWATLDISGDSSWCLPIDHPLVTREALEWYLLSRENRREYRNMFPLIRSALRVLNREAEESKPFVDLLVAESQRRFGLGDEARSMVELAAGWWKTKKRQHRPLVANSPEDAKAFAEILDEVERRVRLNGLVDDPAILARINAACPDAMFVGRRHDGTYVALTPHDDRDCYVTVSTWSAKRGAASDPVEWVPSPDVRAYKTIRSSKRHQSWPLYAPVRWELTGPEVDGVVAELSERYDGLVGVSTQKYWGERRERLVLHRIGAAPVVDVEHPLTGASSKGRLDRMELWWSRRDDGTVEVEESEWEPSSSSSSEIGAPSTNGPAKDRCADWLWADVATIDRVTAEYGAVWAEHVARRDPLMAASSAAHRRLGDAWVQRATEAEYTKFVTKFGAESKGRWDGHRKTIAAKLQFPHRRNDNGLEELFDTAAELGLLLAERVTIDGLFYACMDAQRDVYVDPVVRADLEGLEF